MTPSTAGTFIVIGLLFSVLSFTIEQFYWALRGANISSRKAPRWAGRLIFLFVGITFLYIGIAFFLRQQP